MKSNRDHYLGLLGNEEPTAEVGWKNTELAIERYKAVERMIPFGLSTIADFGCGTGLFLDYLPGYKFVRYTGYDLMPEYVEQANQTRADGVRAIFMSHVEGRQIVGHDCIVAIGTFTLRLGYTDEEYTDYFQAHLRYLLASTHRCLIMTGFSKAADFFADHLYYHDVNTLLRIGKEEGFYVEVSNELAGHEFIAKFTRK